MEREEKRGRERRIDSHSRRVECGQERGEKGVLAVACSLWPVGLNSSYSISINQKGKMIFLFFWGGVWVSGGLGCFYNVILSSGWMDMGNFDFWLTINPWATDPF